MLHVFGYEVLYDSKFERSVFSYIYYKCSAVNAVEQFKRAFISYFTF